MLPATSKITRKIWSILFLDFINNLYYLNQIEDARSGDINSLLEVLYGRGF